MAPHKQMKKETSICLWGVFYHTETLINHHCAIQFVQKKYRL